MTLQDELLSLYSGDALVRMHRAVLESGLPPNDIYFVGAIEARRATLAADKAVRAAEEAVRTAELAREDAKGAVERSDRAINSTKETSTKITAAVTSALDINRGIQRELGSPRILTKVIISRLGSALITIATIVVGFSFIQSRMNSRLAQFMAEEKKLTSASNAALIDKSLELARRGNFNATSCYALAAALSLPTTKAAWDPAQGAIIAFPASSGVQVIQTNNQTHLIFPKSGAENFHQVLRDISEGGFLDLTKEAYQLSKPSEP